ncbi:Protein of unknown function [Micromonospora lupini str. Lupac 08]|uniref:Uncharacterized protein n=1 Tax=Micromonospora lupini str. Lupac 08 TaxID=1150864 RepID=I0KWM7_9ACTN|nr:Protein of unknown function [Micromonospora lupini str. Lupac 08]
MMTPLPDGGHPPTLGAPPLLCFNPRNGSAANVVRGLKQSKGRLGHLPAPPATPRRHPRQRGGGGAGWRVSSGRG